MELLIELFLGGAREQHLAHYRCKHNDTYPTNALPLATYPIDVGLCCNSHEWIPFDVVWVVHPTSFGGCLCMLHLVQISKGKKTWDIILKGELYLSESCT